MSDYKKMAEIALKLAANKEIKKEKSKVLNESIVYPDGMGERMNPKLETELAERKHSLGKHPIFPDDDEATFEQKIMGRRFSEVAKRYKRAFDIDTIDNQRLLVDMLPLVKDSMALESKHRKKLEKLAEQMIREEFDMDKDVVEIHCELVDSVNMDGTKKNPKPMAMESSFKNHDEIVAANEEVYKRRFVNSMIQGAAKKTNHMFHMVDEELTELDPRLPNKYAKMMAAADYMFYVIPEMEDDSKGSVTGGIVKVQFPTASNPKAIIHAQAMVFPVLIHELVKGVMELMSAHGLPKQKRIGEYVINKADFLAAEPWDMRLGPGIWEQFTTMIEPDDFNIKHHIYTELVKLPVKEFNMKMREIMAGTKEGKKIINSIVKEVRQGLAEDEFNEAIEEIGGKTQETHQNDIHDTFGLDELLRGDDQENNNDIEGYDFDDLL